MASKRSIIVNITGTNGDYTASFVKTTIGKDGEHKNTKLLINVPTEWLRDSCEVGSVMVVEYLNAKGKAGRSVDIDLPTTTSTMATYEVPRDALYSPQTLFSFNIYEPISETENRVIKSAQAVVYVDASFSGGSVDAPFGSDAFQELLILFGQYELIVNSIAVAEQGRVSAEGLRDIAENARDNAETGRSNKEGLRVIAETGRNNAEGLRINAEISRETGESNRNTAYGIAEGNRDSLYNTAEADRDNLYDGAEISRDDKYDLQETARDGLYSGRENTRDDAYDAQELVRDGLYSGRENTRDDAYDAQELVRDGLYTGREDNRDDLYNIAELAREGALIAHKNATMPHQAKDLKENKTYIFGLQLSAEGNPQLIYEEVI